MVAAALCVAGAALGDIHLRFAWQAWRLATSTVTLRGRRGAYGFAWQACYFYFGTGLALVARLLLLWRRGTLRGRRGAWRNLRSFHVAGVAPGDIHRRFAWQACYLWDWAGSGDALGPAGALRHCAWQAWHLATSPSHWKFLEEVDLWGYPVL